MPLDGSHLNQTTAHLIRAKNYLQNKGWCSDGPIGDGGTVCIAEAIGKTAGYQDIFGPNNNAGFVMGVALGVEPSHYDGHSIGLWNDTPGRTIEEVLDAFDRAIAMAMEEDG